MLTPEQLALRRTGIGGSEIAAVVGESAFSSPFDVWLSKVEGWCRPATPDMERGTFLESGIAEWLSHRTGWRLSACDTLRHAANDVALCTPDRLAETELGLAVVEIKAPRRGGVLWGRDGTDDVPPEYLLQLQWEHLVLASRMTVAETLYLAALVDGDLRLYQAAADRELQLWLLTYATEWWDRHVRAMMPPSMDGSSQAAAWLRAKFKRDAQPVRQATPHEDVVMLAMSQADAELARLREERSALENELKFAIGDSGGLESPAGRVTWHTDKRGTRSFRTQWTKPKHERAT